MSLSTTHSAGGRTEVRGFTTVVAGSAITELFFCLVERLGSTAQVIGGESHFARSQGLLRLQHHA